MCGNGCKRPGLCCARWYSSSGRGHLISALTATRVLISKASHYRRTERQFLKMLSPNHRSVQVDVKYIRICNDAPREHDSRRPCRSTMSADKMVKLSFDVKKQLKVTHNANCEQCSAHRHSAHHVVAHISSITQWLAVSTGVLIYHRSRAAGLMSCRDRMLYTPGHRCWSV
jgi:hypothetical protein